jgi:hypothetical protein
MRLIFPLLFLAMLATGTLHAEGTRELAPNGSITIGTTTTTDIAALHINHPLYGSFASYNNPDTQSRLFIHIKNPATECIYLGFNWAHNNFTGTNPPRMNFEYRIKDPAGNVVFGPVIVTPATANIQTWAQGFGGPQQLFGGGGYEATEVSSSDLQSQGWTSGGNYYIEFRDFEGNDFLIDFWDITVVDCLGAVPVEKKGRIWSYNWAIFAINDIGFPLRPFNGAFYVCAPDPDAHSEGHHKSFITKIDFNNSGFQPAAFNIAFNSFGCTNSGDISEDRKSVQNRNATQAEYAIFLNDPVDICETAEVGNIEIVGVSRCDGDEFCIKIIAHKAGQVSLLLDFDGEDGKFTPGTADVSLVYSVAPEDVGKAICLPWNGLNGLGEPLFESIATRIPVVLQYAQGVYHFPIYDAEYLFNGFQITAVRPASPVTLLFYDDSNITRVSGSGEPQVQLDGCMPPCHTWSNYTGPDDVGFGNLNTINSWWFSQLIEREEVFFLPGYVSCDIDGPDRLCQGAEAELHVNYSILPTGALGVDVISILWEGPAIKGTFDTETIIIGRGGEYQVTIQWITNLGDTCTTTCSYFVIPDPPLYASIDTILVQGDTLFLNGGIFTEAGEHFQQLNSVEGCDSILTINIIVINGIIQYDFDNCESFMSNNTHMDFSEFVPTYPQPLSCAEITAGIVHLEPGLMSKHSCTPGVGGSPGMCVPSLDTCTYVPGHEASIIIEIEVIPHPDTAVYLTGFSFFEQAPLMYNWISGSSGPSNNPQFFGVRILKNGTVIYQEIDIPTQTDWNERVYSFLGNPDFLVTDTAHFRFELLPYCPADNGAIESVWDLDDLQFFASCASPDVLDKTITGRVISHTGKPLVNNEVVLYRADGITELQRTVTDITGSYSFEGVRPQASYVIAPKSKNDYRNGVTTLDLIYMQRHLLSMQPLEPPYEYIAADINRHAGISAVDVVELRRLLLGLYNSFPGNTSWRFISDIQTSSNPWMISESHVIEYLVNRVDEMDFTAVKIGDVDGTAAVGLRDKVLSFRSDLQAILVAMPNEDGESLEIRAGNDLSLMGMQLAMVVHGGVPMRLVEGVLALSDDHYYITPEGLIRLSWNGVAPMEIKEGDLLFKVELDQKSLKPAVAIATHDILHSEAYVGEDVNSANVELRSTEYLGAEKNDATLVSVQPNPFSQELSVKFVLDHADQVEVCLFDLSGRKVMRKSMHFNRGQHTLTFTGAELGQATGMMICRLQVGDTSEYRMVVRM